VVVALTPREVARVVENERHADEREPRTPGNEGGKAERAPSASVMNPEPPDV
jgi:hypothetical protein